MKVFMFYVILSTFCSSIILFTQERLNSCMYIHVCRYDCPADIAYVAYKITDAGDIGD